MPDKQKPLTGISPNKNGLPVKTKMQAGNSWVENYNDCRQNSDRNPFFADVTCTIRATVRTLTGR